MEGRVERIPALPGVQVEADTVLLEMSDPEMEQNLLEAEAQLRAGEADYDDLRAQLESQLLDQQGAGHRGRVGERRRRPGCRTRRTRSWPRTG